MQPLSLPPFFLVYCLFPEGKTLKLKSLKLQVCTFSEMWECLVGLGSSVTKELDTDGDGQITLEEMKAACSCLVWGIFWLKVFLFCSRISRGFTVLLVFLGYFW